MFGVKADLENSKITQNKYNLEGNCTPNQKLTCFLLYLKIINTFLKKIIYASYSKFSKKLRNSIEI